MEKYAAENFKSTEAHQAHKFEELQQNTSSSSLKTFSKFLLFLVGAAGLYRLNEMFDPKDHPLSRFIGSYLDYFKSESIESLRKSFFIRQRAAEDAIILNTPVPERSFINFPGIFERASDFVIGVGSQVDVSNVNFKSYWAKDDAYK